MIFYTKAEKAFISQDIESSCVALHNVLFPKCSFTEVWLSWQFPPSVVLIPGVRLFLSLLVTYPEKNGIFSLLCQIYFLSQANMHSYNGLMMQNYPMHYLFPVSKVHLCYHGVKIPGWDVRLIE